MFIDELSGSQDGVEEQGTPSSEGIADLDDDRGAAEGAEDGAQLAPETTGVQPYSDEELERVSPTAIDYRRVKPEHFPKIMHRTLSMQGQIAQKQAERQARENQNLQQRIDSLQEKLQGSENTMLSKVLEKLSNAESARAGEISRVQEQRELEYIESLPEGEKQLYLKLREQERQIKALTERKPEMELPPEVREAVEFAKKTQSEKALETKVQSIDNVIDGIIRTAPMLDDDVKNDERFGNLVRSNISLRWEGEKAQHGKILTSLEQATVIAVKELVGFVGTHYQRKAPQQAQTTQTQQRVGVTPEQAAAAGAPPKMKAAGTPVADPQSKRAFYGNMIADLGFKP